MEDPRHWPYANEYVRSSLDPKLIEQHASEIVARSLIYRRMMAFVGSGVTLGYGRLNWDELVTHVVNHVAGIVPKDAPSDTLLQLIRAAATNQGRAKPLKVDDKTSLLLLCKKVYERFTPATGTPFGQIVADAVKDITQHARNIEGDKPASTEHANNLVHFLERCRVDIAALDEPRHRYIQILSGVEPAPARDRKRIHPSLRAVSAPIYATVSRLGINRLLTTNYDGEIENTFRALLTHHACDATQGDEKPFAPEDDTAAQGHDSSVFDPAKSALALRFAIDGRRPRATVLHLHGIHSQSRDLVVTETDYQRLYLRDGDRRDLVDNSVHALFAASPLLFIGTDLTEDDILRPLRLFMSSYNPRSDRVAVALLPAKKPLNELVLDKIKLLTRYGVHTIHYDLLGSPADGGSPTYPRNGSTHTWLSAFAELKKLVEDGKLAEATAWWAQLKQDATRASPLEREQSLDTPPTLEPDVAMVDHVFDLLHKQPGQERSAYVARVFKETLNSVISVALCRSLLRLAQQRQDWHKLRFNPAPPYQPRTRSYFNETYTRLTLAAAHHELTQPGLQRYTTELHAGDKRVGELLFDLESNPDFCNHDGRRTVLIAGKRGVGKGSLFDALVAPKATVMERLKKVLKIPEGGTTGILALNSTTDLLNLSDIIGRLIGAHAFESNGEVIDSTTLRPRSNIFGRLEYALDRLADVTPASKYRVLIVMAHIGMLFDETGTPKNGLVARFINLLSDDKYKNIPLDMVLFTDESQVPVLFRRFLSASHPQPPRKREEPLGKSPHLEYQEWREHEATTRLDRLQLGVLRANKRMHLHVPHREWASILALRHFPALWASIPGEKDDDKAAHDERWFKGVNRMTGGSRICLTMLFALAEEACLLGIGAPVAEGQQRLSEFQQHVLGALTGHPLESVPDSALNYIFDRWSALHVETLAVDGTLDRRVESILKTFLRDKGTADHVISHPGAFWRFCQELLWHLAVVSHPVDSVFLTRCPDLRKGAWHLLGKPKEFPADALVERLIEAALEVSVFRCLVFRQMPGTREKGAPYRYSVHRLVQRYFFRRMGGKNVELTDWDQFSTTLYSSQPDDAPTFTTAAHKKLTELIRSLAKYPPMTPGQSFAEAPEGPASLRQAYFVLRATYSVGALSRISRFGDGSHGAPDHGFLEDYRRLVRWITLQATRQQAAIFHPGELVWLYNECGVVNLAQGKLEDADSALTLAEAAAGMAEPDPTGSLHVRVRLNAALVMIERGRPLRARAMLLPIAQRVGGNATSPLVAHHYLGLLEHLAGNYAEADHWYRKAECGLSQDKRWRALARLKKDMADLHLVRHPNETEKALAIVNEAMDLAQRGGHEDVRILCMLTRAGIHAQSKSPADHAKVYGALLDAERYALELDMPRVVCEAREIRACMLLLQGETRLSASEASRSLEIAALYDMKLRKARGLLTLARIYHARADNDGALALIETGSEIAASSEYYACVKGFRELQIQIDPSGRRAATPIGAADGPP